MLAILAFLGFLFVDNFDYVRHFFKGDSKIPMELDKKLRAKL